MKRSIMGKVYVVENDLKEKGLWQILNFGHTIGHAIEAHENGKLLHGEAVAIGTILELNLTNQDIKSKVSNLYKKYEICYELPSHVKLENLL